MGYFIILTFQLGNIFMLTYVYNLVRIYSSKSSDANSPVPALSIPETGPENASAHRMEPLVTSQDMSQTNERVIGLETENAMQEGEAKVVLHSNIVSINMFTPYYVYFNFL